MIVFELTYFNISILTNSSSGLIIVPGSRLQVQVPVQVPGSSPGSSSGSSQVPIQVPARFQPGSSQVPARFQPGSSPGSSPGQINYRF
jgi:hypothetical protein